MTLEHTLTRAELYRARDEPAPNGDGERRCRGCGTSLEGRAASAVWCSVTCRNRRRNRSSSGDLSDHPPADLGHVIELLLDAGASITFDVDGVMLLARRDT